MDTFVLVIIGVVIAGVLIWSLRKKSKTIQRLFNLLPKPPAPPSPRRGKKKKIP